VEELINQNDVKQRKGSHIKEEEVKLKEDKGK